MGRTGARVEQHLAWEHQQEGYLRVFDDLVGHVADTAPLADAGPDGVRRRGAYQQPDGKVLVAAMVDRIAHRGPDAGAVVELVDPDTAVVLGHRRLSIIDLSSAADQPFAKGASPSPTTVSSTTTAS